VKVSSRIVFCTLVLVLLGSALPTRAQHKLKDEDCLSCHGDASLTTDVNGKPVSLFVDAKKMKQSVHGGMFACVDCHKDVKSLAHETRPQKISCAECHADAQAAYGHSMHAKAASGVKTLAANCQDCHGIHSYK
jgi:nitrate/TMAO reductase-like tetraheme cytochrome c subunit